MTANKNNPEANDFMPDNEPITDAALAGNSDFTADQDASEWKPFADVDIATLSPQHSGQFANTIHAVGEVPVDSRREAIAERRAYADQSQVVSAEVVSDLGNRRYSAFSVTAPVGPGLRPGQPVMLLGDDRSRVRTMLSNAHLTELVVIGPYDQVSTGNGLVLPPNALFETNVTQAIYACVPSAGAEAVQVGVWSEYA